MTDEETWERRWHRAMDIIVEQEMKIERLSRVHANLEAMWDNRPTGTAKHRENVLAKQVEQLTRERDQAVTRATALEIQVKRLLAREGERLENQTARAASARAADRVDETS